MKKLFFTFLLILLMFPVVYCETSNNDDLPDLIPYRKGDKLNFRDRYENIVIESMDLDLPDLIPYRKGNKWGFCDKDKNIVIECKYDAPGYIYKDAVYAELNGKMGVWDFKGREIIPPIYDYIRVFGDYAVVRHNGKEGISDLNGNVLVPIKYDRVGTRHRGGGWTIGFPEYLTLVELNNKWGLINSNGEEVVRIKSDYPPYTVNPAGCFIVSFNKKTGIIDKDGNTVVSFKYDGLVYINENLILANLNGKKGYININGKEIIPIIYDDLEGGGRILYYAKFNGKYGYIDKENNIIIPFEYESAKMFSNNIAIVKKDKK